VDLPLIFILGAVVDSSPSTQPRIRKQAGVLLGTCINILPPDSDVSPASPVEHILGYALKRLRSASPSSNSTRSPSPDMALAMGGDGGGGGQSISEVLLGTLQIFDTSIAPALCGCRPSTTMSVR